MDHLKKSILAILTLLLAFSLTYCKTTEDSGRSFWVDYGDEVSYDWKKINADLMHQSEHANVWVKQDEKKYISQELIDVYGNFFSDSVFDNVSNYVYKITEFFGEKGDRINILFYLGDESIAGYFWVKDFYTDKDTQDIDIRSNETNIFYMNINAAVSDTNQDIATLFTKGTLAHEFQHMTQAHYFTFSEENYVPLDTWADELCSTTIESIFAKQAQIYLASYNSDSLTEDKLFATGVRLVGWDNYFEQYTAAALFGTFIMSQLAESNRPNLIKTFMKNSYSGDTTLYDLIYTLENSQVGYWTSTTSLTDKNAVRTKWASLLDDFIRKGVLGIDHSNNTDTTYIDYLNKISGTTTMSITPQVVTATGSINLQPSAWVIAKVSVTDLYSNSGPTSNTGGTAAYAVAYHDGLYQYDDYWDLVLPASIATDTFTVVTKSTPVAKKVSLSMYPFNRSMNPLFFLDALLPGGKRSVSDQTITDGSIQYFYTPR